MQRGQATLPDLFFFLDLTKDKAGSEQDNQSDFFFFRSLLLRFKKGQLEAKEQDSQSDFFFFRTEI